MTVSVDIKALLAAGAHFGHNTSRWHPAMAPYIHSKRQGIHIIDLTKTVEALEKVLPVVTETAARGRAVLFVGTKRQAKDIVRTAAEEIGQPFVTERWMGGMLTNSATVNTQIRHLKQLENRMASGDLAKRFNKLEVQRFQEEIDSLNLKYGGIKELNGKPGLVFVTDIIEDRNAVREAKKLGVPVAAIVDSNANPGEVDYPIPANDDAIRALQLIIGYIAEAAQEGKNDKAAADVRAADAKTAPAQK
ncbi:30S ribosomal protein S2 [Candidatus Saccharibacteria bacterium]|nr:30S ribosomal protein S2 [Candidatus Saccharibacteria bacterium]